MHHTVRVLDPIGLPEGMCQHQRLFEWQNVAQRRDFFRQIRGVLEACVRAGNLHVHEMLFTELQERG